VRSEPRCRINTNFVARSDYFVPTFVLNRSHLRAQGCLCIPTSRSVVRTFLSMTRAAQVQAELSALGKFSATGVWDPSWGPERASFSWTSSREGGQCWHAAVSDVNQWLMVSWGGAPVTVSSFATKGRLDHDQWVTQYLFEYTLDGITWINPFGAGVPRAGNTDRNSVVHHDLPAAVRARAVRVRPTAWHNFVVMRLAVYGSFD